VKPLVSVIIPAYNAEKYLKVSVDSVMMQTYKNIEIIIVDDGSIDATASVASEYRDRVRYVYQKNSGPSEARNKGVQLSKGELIAFLDADDQWLPEKLERQVACFEKYTGIYYVGCGVYDVDQSGSVFSQRKGLVGWSQDALIRGMKISNIFSAACSYGLVKKECFAVLGLFDTKMRGSEDRDMWFRIAKAYKGAFLEEPLIKYRFHNANSHKNISMMQDHQKTFINKYRKEYSIVEYRKAMSAVFFDAAGEYYEQHNKTKMLVNALYSIYYYPFKLSLKDTKYKMLVSGLLPAFVIAFFNKKNIGKKK
jgi:glycosyltransferase involved in cell wall biosynthesis